MATITGPSKPETTANEQAAPLPLHNGDHLDQPTFHARYERSPDAKAELIEGIVYMPSPLGPKHAQVHAEIIGVLHSFKARTSGVILGDNATTILGPDSEVQPDVFLAFDARIANASLRIDESGFFAGAPELVVEVASSSAAIDLFAKKRSYERAGVREYLVACLDPAAVRRFERRGESFEEAPPPADGVHRSSVFPGLWLDAAALFRLDSRTLLDVLGQGIAAPEHQVFAAELAAAIKGDAT